MCNKRYKRPVAVFFAMTLLSWPYLVDAHDGQDAHRRGNERAGHQGADMHHGHAGPPGGAFNHGHNGRYYHDRRYYNYYHNGSYYDYFFNGNYYLYFINGAYYNYFYNGAYYKICKEVPGYWSYGHWNPSIMICQ